MSLRYAQIKFSVEELKSLPDRMLVTYLAAGQINNDLAILHKLIVRANPKESQNPIVWNSRFTMSVMLVLFASGRIHEAWKTLNKHLNLLEKEYRLVSKMPKSDQDCWDEVKRYFSQSNTITMVRDKVAFHGETDHFVSALNLIPADFELTDFHFETTGNSIFGTGDLIRLAGIAQLLKKDDLMSGFNELSVDSIKYAKKILVVCWGILRVILNEKFPEKLKNMRREELDIELEPISKPLSFFYAFPLTESG